MQGRSAKVAVIGAGFSGLSAAACLGAAGYNVTVWEKHDIAGGRARQFSDAGFAFDMGPSWYWMPDVFEKFFNRFGRNASDFYKLERLDPSYRIYYGTGDCLDVPATVEKLYLMFEQLEPGSGTKLIKFLNEAKYKYDVGINNLVYKPGLHWRELLDMEVVRGVFRMQLFSSLAAHVRGSFKNDRLIQLLEFPSLFLGATPRNTPALYSLMNYADMSLGTWYPQGGMYQVIKAMEAIARQVGVQFEFNSNVERILLKEKAAKGLLVNGQEFSADYVVASADYHHVEQQLLPADSRKYTQSYWDGRAMAPSALIFFVGLNKKVKGLLHHTLFFDEDFQQHAREIYTDPQWPTAPQFYVSCTSKTDASVAPAGHENLFILIPTAQGLRDTPEIREKYFAIVIKRLESILGDSIENHIIYKRSYAHRDFTQDYNAFRGNAYGLANTLMQTANLKPSMVNKKVNNLFYTGQLTVPGPGVPPAIISGQVAANLIISNSNQQ